MEAQDAVKVLIADDEAGNRDLLGAVFCAPRWQPFFACDGEEAIELCRTLKPAILFLDIVMPKRNGWEVCEAIKSDRATQHIKIIMISALMQDSHKRRAFQFGADAYVTKPISVGLLRNTVQAVL